MSDKRRIVENTLANGFAQAAALISSLIFMPMLINAFGLVDYGLFLITTTVAQYSQLLDFGVGASLVKLVAEHDARDDREGIGPVASAALMFYLVIGVVIAAIMVGLAFTTAFWMSKTTPASSLALLQRLLLVGAVFALWQWPANTFMYVLNGFQRFTVTARVQLAVTVANIGVYIAVLVTHHGPVALFAGTSAVLMLGSLVNVYLGMKQLAGVRVSPARAKSSFLKQIFRLSWAIFLVQLSSVILYQQTDRLVLAVFVGAAAVGLYEGAGKFMGLITQLTAFANSAVIPMASRLDASGEYDKLRMLFLRGTKYVLALVAPVVAVLVVLARPILVKWLGPQFADMAVNAQILVAPHLLIVGGTIGDSIIVGTGALKRRLPYSLAMTAANLVLSLLLVRPLGIRGVVLGTAIPYLIDYPIHIWWLLRELKVPASRWFREVVLPVYPLLLVPVGLAVVGALTPLASSLAGLGLLGVVSVGAYFAALYLVGLTDAERADVQAGLATVRERFAR